MNISSSQSNTILYELKEHTAGCQCPGCCKKDMNSQSTGMNKDDITTSDKIGADSSDLSSEKKNNSNTSELTLGQQQELLQLQQRDFEVRAHEAAHIAAGGSVISSGSASFSYQKGPDGRLYAIGGEVSISSSGGNTPEEKITIARQIQAGALAPANPSPQDLKVASSAAMMEAQARQDLALQKSEEQKEQAVNIYSGNQSKTEQEKSTSIRLHA